MTVMEQIGMISTLARERGMTYGEYVSTYGDKIPAPQARDAKPIQPKKCVVCGAEFVSKFPNRTRCYDCIAIDARPPRKHKFTKVYDRACTLCGAVVRTTQAPRQGCNIYCGTCREIAKRSYAKKTDH